MVIVAQVKWMFAEASLSVQSCRVSVGNGAAKLFTNATRSVKTGTKDTLYYSPSKTGSLLWCFKGKNRKISPLVLLLNLKRSGCILFTI